jgi:hypothetical protein
LLSVLSSVLSEGMVGRHLDNTFAELDVSSRADAPAAAAVRLGLA